jgi:hypothetical protein
MITIVKSDITRILTLKAVKNAQNCVKSALQLVIVLNA